MIDSLVGFSMVKGIIDAHVASEEYNQVSVMAV